MANLINSGVFKYHNFCSETKAFFQRLKILQSGIITNRSDFRGCTVLAIHKLIFDRAILRCFSIKKVQNDGWFLLSITSYCIKLNVINDKITSMQIISINIV